MALLGALSATVSSASAASHVLTLNATPDADGSVVVPMRTDNAATPTSVTDSKGNTWAWQSAGNTSLDRAHLLYCLNMVAPLVSGDTITVNLSAANTFRGRVWESTALAGVDVTHSFANIGTTSGTTNSATTTNTSSTDIAVITFGGTVGSVAVSSGGYTQADAQTVYAVASKDLTATGDIKCSWTWTTAQHYSALAVGFIPAKVARAGFSAAGSMSVDGTAVRPGSAGMSATASMSVTGFATRPGALAMSATAAMAVGAVITMPGTAVMSADGAMSIDGVIPPPGSVNFAGLAAMSVAGALEGFAAVAMTASASLSITGQLGAQAAPAMTAAGAMSVGGFAGMRGAIAMTAAATMGVLADSGPPIPTMKIELRLAGVWTDVTSYVNFDAGWQVSRGRQNEFDRCAPGQFQCVFDNSDGRFTSDKADGPYYPHLRVNTPIRSSVNYVGVDYRRFTGYVNDWPTTWQGGSVSLVQITATDRFKILSRGRRRGNLLPTWQQAVIADGPTAYYPLTEPSEAATVTDLTGRAPDGTIALSKYGGSYEMGADGLGGTGANSMRFVGGGQKDPTFHYDLYGKETGARIDFPAGGLIHDAPFSIETWFNAEIPNRLQPTGFDDLFSHTLFVQLDYVGAIDGVVNSGAVGLWLADSGEIIGIIGNPSTGVLAQFLSTAEITDRLDHQIVFGLRGDKKTPFCYLDGKIVPNSYGVRGNAPMAFTDPLARPSSRTFIGGWNDGASEVDYWNGRLQGFAIFDVALSTRQVQSHYKAGLNGFAGERSDQRIVRIGGWAGLGPDDLDMEVGNSLVDRQDTGGQAPLDAMRQVEQTEQGVLFIAGGGKTTFHSRRHRVNQTVDFTVDVAQLSNAIAFNKDEGQLVNDFTVTYPTGSVRRVDIVSQQGDGDDEGYGVYADSIDTLHMGSAAAGAMADYRIGRVAQPRTGLTSIVLDPVMHPDLWPAVLGSEIGQRFQVTGEPPPQAPDGWNDMNIEQLTESGTASTWSLAMQTSLADAVPYFIADHPIYGRVDAGNRVGW